MLVRLMGATSNPSSAWFSSSSWKARFSASIAAKVNVTHRMLGARSIAATAVGSRPKLNTMRTSAVNTTAERIAVRVRNSSTRSLRASVHAWRSVSLTGHYPPVLFGHRAGRAAAARPKGHEPAALLERDVGGELDALVHVVRRNHHDPPRAGELRQQAAELGRRRQVEAREGLVQQQHARLVQQRAGDRRALHQAPRERAHRLLRPNPQPTAAQRLVHTGPPPRGPHGGQGGPKKQGPPHPAMPAQGPLITHRTGKHTS